MAAKTSWHRYETKLRHGHPVYSAASLCAGRDVTDCNRCTSVGLGLAAKYGLSDVREGLSVIRDSVWSCFVQKVQL